MKLSEVPQSVANLFCSCSRYALEWKWALVNDWWELTISQFLMTVLIVFFTWANTVILLSNLKAGFSDYRNKKRGVKITPRDQQFRDRDREVRQDWYAYYIKFILVILILPLFFAEIVTEMFNSKC